MNTVAGLLECVSACAWQRRDGEMSEFTGSKHFVIYPCDVGTKAYHDKYVRYLEQRLAAAEAARGIAEQQLTVICDGVNRRCGKGPNELPLVSMDGVVKERDEFRQLLRDVLRGRRRFMRDTLGDVLFESVKAAAGDM